MTKGIEFRFNAPFQSNEKQEDGSLLVHLDNCEPIPADAVLVATGRVPNTKGLGLEELGGELAKHGAVKVDETTHSSVPSIHAVGHRTTAVQGQRASVRVDLGDGRSYKKKN